MSQYRDDPVQGDSLAACISKYLASREYELRRSRESTHLCFPRLTQAF